MLGRSSSRSRTGCLFAGCGSLALGGVCQCQRRRPPVAHTLGPAVRAPDSAVGRTSQLLRILAAGQPCSGNADIFEGYPPPTNVCIRRGQYQLQFPLTTGFHCSPNTRSSEEFSFRGFLKTVVKYRCTLDKLLMLCFRLSRWYFFLPLLPLIPPVTPLHPAVSYSPTK
ncbi:hypothetical protein MJT46_009539 [Ovis ammon polii x Ovis aries]|nr:hypothetical protein MJT46_009539 [Ovis ammon polii x Ovis aries]